jgi:hypothetical protein
MDGGRKSMQKKDERIRKLDNGGRQNKGTED